MHLPGNCAGHFTRLVIPGDWDVLANFVLPRGQAFANPGATLKVLAHTCISIQT